jgi:hypothetical protein
MDNENFVSKILKVCLKLFKLREWVFDQVSSYGWKFVGAKVLDLPSGSRNKYPDNYLS